MKLQICHKPNEILFELNIPFLDEKTNSQIKIQRKMSEFLDKGIDGSYIAYKKYLISEFFIKLLKEFQYLCNEIKCFYLHIIH